MASASVSPPHEITADAVVIGGGFYGCETALELKRLGFANIILAEQEAGLLRRASFVNQARVHNGYHYPRAYGTAVRSRKNFEAFIDEYREIVKHGIEMYYAIAHGSAVNSDQFEAFCQGMGAFCQAADREVELLFEPGSIERIFRVRELAFDASKLAARLRGRLTAEGIDFRLGNRARVLSTSDSGVELEIGARRECARYVFNCTYAEVEKVGVKLNTPIKRELTEILLISPPPQLRGRGFTVMDGPFFSTMPFPATPFHSLSHVRYTPHEASTDPTVEFKPERSNGLGMLRDAARYLPCLQRARIEESLFEVKAVLMQTERDDARPILVERSSDGRIYSILGGKIDNIYDLRDYLRGQIWN